MNNSTTDVLLSTTESFFVKISYKILYIAILSSGYVLIEPAPFDLLILLSIFIILLTGIRFPVQLKWILLIAFSHLIGSFIGVLMSDRFADSYMHVIITTYMSLFTIGLIIIIYNNPHRALNIILSAYIWAALISTLLAILGYFHIGPFYDIFTLYGRAKGGFKDPNVYGPFIVPPMLYLINKIIYSKIRRKLIPSIMFGILLFGLMLSFSRGAWGVFLFSTLIMFASMYYTSQTNRFRVELTLYILVSIICMALALLVALNIPSISDLLLERASLNQAYDVEDGGRFSHHYEALKVIIEKPLGIGAKEFGWTFGEDVHNSYLTTFLIGGWLAGFSFILIVFSTIVVGFKYCFTNHAFKNQFAIFYASFTSLMIEAWIIDMDHWRLFYVLLGIIWGLILYSKYHPNNQNQIHKYYEYSHSRV